MFYNLFSSEEAKHTFGTRYYFWQQKYSEERFTYFLGLIRFAVLFVIVIILSTAVKWYYTYPAFLYLGSIIFLLILILVFSFLRAATPERKREWYTRLLLFILSVMVVISTFGFANYLTFNFKIVEISDIRIGIFSGLPVSSL